MDTQIMGAIKRFPKSFHIGMIPDMRTNFAEADVDAEAQERIDAEHAKWEAELRLFKGSLIVDQKLSSDLFRLAAMHSTTSWSGTMHSKCATKA